VWVPCAHMPRPMTRRGGSMIQVVARLKPGVPLERAQAEMNSIQARIHGEHGHLEQSGSQFAIGPQINLQPRLESVVANVRPSLFMFSGAVSLVLLIACANVANLLLSRAVARQREIAVRTALGAGRWRIMRQLLTESVVLAVAGGVLGVALAVWGVKLVVQFSADSIPRLELVQLDWAVLLFTLGVSLVTGLVFGLAPAWQSSRADLNEALKDGTARVSGGLAHLRLRNAFTVAQVALALMLLVGGGLLLRSFQRLQSVETGFDTEELLTVDMTMTGVAYDQHPKRRIFLQQLVEKLAAVPGVEAACAVSMIPDRGSGWPTPYARMDLPMLPQAQRPRIGVRVMTPGFLKTYGIRLLHGRDFAGSDGPTAGRVLLINQAFADELYPGENPVGKMIDCNGPSQIIGVVANVKNTGLGGETRPEAYGHYQQWDFQSMFATVRARSNPMGLAPVVTDLVRELNPHQPLMYFRTMQSYLDESTARPRFRSLVLGAFALVALLLASVGIYGVMAYSVAQRTQELGIRMALGAQRSDVLKLILRHGLQLTLLGIAIGLAGSLALTRLISSHLFGVTATDPLTFLAVAAVLLIVAMAACLVPARRATKVDPMEALRHE
jgi:putative ABC transport system permease protein